MLTVGVRVQVLDRRRAVVSEGQRSATGVVRVFTDSLAERSEPEAVC